MIDRPAFNSGSFRGDGGSKKADKLRLSPRLAAASPAPPAFDDGGKDLEPPRSTKRRSSRRSGLRRMTREI